MCKIYSRDSLFIIRTLVISKLEFKCFSLKRVQVLGGQVPFLSHYPKHFDNLRVILFQRILDDTPLSEIIICKELTHKSNQPSQTIVTIHQFRTASIKYHIASTCLSVS